MPFEFECQSCHATLRVPDEAKGKAVKCPQCESISHAPTDPTEPVKPVKPVKPFGQFSDFSSPPGDQPYRAEEYGSPYEQSNDQQQPYSNSGYDRDDSAYGSSGSGYGRNDSDSVFGSMDSGYGSSDSGYDSGYSSSPPYGSTRQDSYSSPYASPNYSSSNPAEFHNRQSVKNRTQPAAILWLVIGIVSSIFLSIATIGSILEYVNGLGSERFLFIGAINFLALVGVAGAIAMLNMKWHAFCIIGTICTFLSGVGCCFTPSLIAIWPFVILLMPYTSPHFD